VYVCVCNAVTDRDINKAIDTGCRSLRELRDELGVGACCGRCAECARSVLKESLGQSPRIPAPTNYSQATA
jgi:bacterioferritin-associated ferredoxin